MDFIDIVFDGPPEHIAGRFVEVEGPEGQGVRIGEWIDRGDGFWALRIKWDELARQEAAPKRDNHAHARIDALQREVAFALGQLFAATPDLTVLRGPNDNMANILAAFKEADRQVEKKGWVCAMSKKKNPWHIVSRTRGTFTGPFSTELDCVLARYIAGPDWANGIDMDKATFDVWLKKQSRS